jgi:hypothetical protein
MGMHAAFGQRRVRRRSVNGTDAFGVRVIVQRMCKFPTYRSTAGCIRLIPARR